MSFFGDFNGVARNFSKLEGELDPHPYEVDGALAHPAAMMHMTAMSRNRMNARGLI